MNALTIIQALLAIFLIGAIMMQNRGAGLGASWGGSGEFYITKRGFERFFFKITVVVAILFVIVSFLSLLV